ncbi:MAG: dihydroorotase [Chloroflexi bacterium]|nr:MAG: dihydroorotase [Chloroflexota bacterium]
MNLVLRGVRVIDPMAGVDRHPADVWLRDGVLAAIDDNIAPDAVAVIDLAPAPGHEPLLVCPGFVDLHAHLREPGGEPAETILSGAAAAAAGGFTQVLAMANTRPPVDDPGRVAAAAARAAAAPLRVLNAAAVTRGLQGTALVDVAGCAAAGAAAFTDDGRNSASTQVLSAALRDAAGCDRAVLVHPEDEVMVRIANPETDDVARGPLRPAACEVSAVDSALAALSLAGRGRLHLQHLSVAGAVRSLRAARDTGAAVTAEVTPHHLGMSAGGTGPASLRKVNPPLRDDADRAALQTALREGLIDAVATDHAPHVDADKGDDFDAAAPGMIGLETALAVCLTHGGMNGHWVPVLIDRLTAGPWRVLGSTSGLHPPRLRAGEPADLVIVDPAQDWVVEAAGLCSRSRNTPLLGSRLRGRVLVTMAGGRCVHLDRAAPSGLASLLETAHA